MKILLADDEPAIHAVVKQLSSNQGYAFCGASSGAEALERYAEEKPDLVILDVMMPDMDGYHVCRELRSQGAEVPVIFLSAKGDIVDKGIGFEAGCDDYLVKPFSPSELAMRIKALFRRGASPQAADKGVIESDGLRIDLKKKKVLIEGKAVALTPKEFMILVILASHPGEIFTHEQLIEEVWGKEYVGITSSIAVFISKIREKIEKNPSKPRYLQTVWRFGYRFGD
ncbi:MAG: response regulator transcription factor [Coriobacteriales bacterium]|nr:response regulator transcription factor [Coriobacteriales bacterium]